MVVFFLVMKVKNLITGRFERDKHLKRYKNCEICKEKFFCRSLFKYQTGKYCSRKCQAEAFSIKKVGKRPYQMTDKTRKAISEAKKGIPIWGGKRKVTWLTGENNFNWKGGITTKDVMQRKLFRRSMQRQVFERDNYTCQMCGSRKDLQVDHIQSWADYVELRFNMNNCRTLCAKCHYKITYGKSMPEYIKGWGHNLLERERIAK